MMKTTRRVTIGEHIVDSMCFLQMIKFSLRYMEENPNAGLIDEGSDVEIDYDEDGNPIAPPRKREIDPLPSIDHSEIDYKPFEKNFYTAHEEIQNLSRSQVDDLRHRLGIKVTGPVPPR